MAIICAGNGKEIYLDDADMNKVSSLVWYVNNHGYAIAHLGKRIISMHRFILDFPPSDIDHINGNKLDNRRSNLRPCSRSQNCSNQKHRSTNSSGYKGVYWNKDLKKYHAQIMIDYHRKHLGYYDNPKDAAMAYNQAAEKYFGEFARLNQNL